jgi:hypothetical protein
MSAVRVIPSRQARNRDLPVKASVGRGLTLNSGIQNPGVDRMSEMSSMLCIPLYRDVPFHREPN